MVLPPYNPTFRFHGTGDHALPETAYRLTGEYWGSHLDSAASHGAGAVRCGQHVLVLHTSSMSISGQNGLKAGHTGIPVGRHALSAAWLSRARCLQAWPPRHSTGAHLITWRPHQSPCTAWCRHDEREWVQGQQPSFCPQLQGARGQAQLAVPRPCASCRASAPAHGQEVLVETSPNECAGGNLLNSPVLRPQRCQHHTVSAPLELAYGEALLVDFSNPALTPAAHSRTLLQGEPTSRRILLYW